MKAAARIERLPRHFFSTLVQKAAALNKEGIDVIDLGRGSPDLATPPHILQALQEASLNPLYHRYSPFEGYPEIRRGTATWYAHERGVEIDPETEVSILFGSKIGLVEVALCLLEPGDVCLVPDPGYPDYLSGIAMANAEAYPMPLVEANEYLPDFASIPKSVLERAKLMFLNYPGNPTARFAPKAFFEKAISLAKEYNIIIAHDYAYGALGFDGRRPISFLEADGAKDVGIEFYSLSKTYSMSGWRVGFALGNPMVIGLINKLQNHFFANIPPAIQMMAAKALVGPQDCIKEMVEVYETRRNLFLGGLKEIGWEAEPPQGTFFAWLPIPENMTSQEYTNLLLEKAHIVVAPGTGFGSHGEGYVRAGLLHEIPRLLEAVERIGSLKVWK